MAKRYPSSEPVPLELVETDREEARAGFLGDVLPVHLGAARTSATADRAGDPADGLVDLRLGGAVAEPCLLEQGAHSSLRSRGRERLIGGAMQ